MTLTQDMADLDIKIQERIKNENEQIAEILAARPELATVKQEMDSLKRSIDRYESSISTDKRKIRSGSYSETSILANAITQNTSKMKVLRQKFDHLELVWIKELNLYPEAVQLKSAIAQEAIASPVVCDSPKQIDWANSTFKTEERFGKLVKRL